MGRHGLVRAHPALGIARLYLFARAGQKGWALRLAARFALGSLRSFFFKRPGCSALWSFPPGVLCTLVFFPGVLCTLVFRYYRYGAHCALWWFATLGWEIRVLA